MKIKSLITTSGTIKGIKIIDNQIKNNKQKKIITKCAKMTEENDFIRNGIINNGANNNLIQNNSTFLLTRNNNNNNNNELIIDETGGTGSSSVVSYKTTTANTTTTNTSSSINDITTNNRGDASPSSSNNKQINNISTTGGRLQFFKDGKFILELARAREGDRTSWVSVPRKTFWPPTAPPTSSSVNYHKNESSTSLSFSDDNSSIQSSPWQRDHCWKQSSPRRYISKEMNLYYYRPFSYNKLTNETKKFAKLKCRRPYDLTTFEINLKNLENGSKNKLNEIIVKIKDEKNDAHEKDDKKSDDCVDGKDSIEDKNNIDDKNLILKEKQNNLNDEKKFNKNLNKILKNRPKLKNIIQKLIEEIKIKTILPTSLLTTTATTIGTSSTVTSLSGNNNNIINYSTQSSRLDLHHSQHVSPRKRILREFEKVSLDDTTTMKRSRAKISTNSNNFNNNNLVISSSSTASIMSSPSTSSSLLPVINSIQQQPINFQQTNSNKITNGGVVETPRIHPPITQPQSVSRPISSYSITSLLGHNSNNHNNNNNNSNSSTSHNLQNKEQNINNMADPSQLRAMLTSPKSPEYIQNKIGYDKKRSPNYNNSIHLSPKVIGSASSTTTTSTSSTVTATTTTHRYNNDRSPGNITDSPYNLIRSPGLSPSPENHQQGFHRFRHYGSHNIPSAASSPNNYHPYMSSSSSSRCSPSTGTLSPTSDLYNNRYRPSNYLLGSPNHHQYQTTSSTSTTTTTATSINSCNNTSPLYSRQSPQYNNINSKHVISSPTHHLNSLNITVNKIRESPPSLSPNPDYQRVEHHNQLHQHNSSHHQGGSVSNTKTNSKKTASQRQQQQQQQQYGGNNASGNASSASHASNLIPDSYYNKTNNKNERITPTTQTNIPGRRSPDRLKELEYLGNHNNVLSGFDIDPSFMLRPHMVPSLSQHPQQSPMLFMHPSYQNPNLGPPPGSFIPYYNQIQYMQAYRNSVWMHYPGHSRMPMMPYPGIGLGPPVHNLQTATQWNQLPNAISTDQLMKDEPSSDVPLNLSKH